jgi:hypothetical protein
MSKYKIRKLKKPKEVVTPEQAIEEFCQMLEHWDLDFELEEDADKDDKKDRGNFADMIIDGIVYGKITIGDDHLPMVHTRNVGTLKFKESYTLHQIAMDKRKKDHDISKLVAAICSWCGDGSIANKMLQQEMNLCIALYIFFFA